MKKNEHIHFAWLVSLNTNIDKRDNGIFVFEWISEKQCIVHINNLLSLEEPKNILKTIYYLCKIIYKCKNLCENMEEMMHIGRLCENISVKSLYTGSINKNTSVNNPSLLLNKIL